MDFRHFLYLLFTLIVFDILTLTEGINIIVKTSKGRVKGVTMNSRGDSSSQMLAFKGIPYAEPPINELRFKAPVACKKWKGTRILSDVDKPFCPQPAANGSTDAWGYSENCLFVNVYTPLNVTAESKLPVMAWIHGGGFIKGSGGFSTGNEESYATGPDYLVDKNVIVVTLNYRLGALGFLSLGTDDAPGNVGLKDQSLALKWIHDEITLFGGDPNQVTIFGESTGSASVHFHIISNMSTGLFQRAIGESGTTLSDWAFIKTGYVERAKQLAVKLNCITTDGGVNMACLQNARIQDILNKQQFLVLPEELTIVGTILFFAPTLEVNTTAPFLSDTPQNLIKDPPNKVPMIVGINEFEGINFVPSNQEFYNVLPEKMLYFIPNATREKITNYTLYSKIKKINQFYFNNTTPSLGNLQGYVNLISDKMFALATADTAKALTQFSKIYLYRFDYDGNFRLPFKNRLLKGASHGDDLGYIFSITGTNTEESSLNSPEMKVLQKMVKLWTNFAKYGTPTIETVDADLENTQWTPISVNTTNYLIINENLTMSIDNFLEQSVDFWEDIKSTDNVTPPPSPITPPLPTTIPPTNATSAPTTVPSPTTDTSAPTTVTSSTNATSAPTTVPSPTTDTSAPTTVTSSTNATSAPTTVPSPTTDTSAPTTVTSSTNATSAPTTVPSPTTDTSAPTTVTSSTNATSAPTTVPSPTTDTSAPTTVTSSTNATSAPTTVPSPTTDTSAPTTVTSSTNATSAPTTVPSPTTDTSAPTTVTSSTNSTSAPTTLPSPTTDTSAPTTVPSPTTDTSGPITPAPTLPPTPSPSSSTYIKFNIFYFIFTVFIMFQLL